MSLQKFTYIHHKNYYLFNIFNGCKTPYEYYLKYLQPISVRYVIEIFGNLILPLTLKLEAIKLIKVGSSFVGISAHHATDKPSFKNASYQRKRVPAQGNNCQLITVFVCKNTISRKNVKRFIISSLNTFSRF